MYSAGTGAAVGINAQELKACLPFPFASPLTGPQVERLVACGLVAKLHVMSEGFVVSSVPVCIPCLVVSCNVPDHVILGLKLQGFADIFCLTPVSLSEMMSGPGITLKISGALLGKVSAVIF